MTTKAYHRFKQRCDYYDCDLELLDILVNQFRAIPNTNQNLAVALGSTKANYQILGRRRNTQQSRNVVGGHLKSIFIAGFIKDIYEDFEEFVAETMVRAAQKGIDAARFVGSYKLDIDAKFLLDAGDWDTIVRKISNEIFRKLENERSTIKVINGAINRLGLTIPALTIDSALPFLECRHLLVHQDGKADAAFRAKYPTVRVATGKIVLSRQFATDAKKAIDDLAKAIDDEIIARGLVRPEDMRT
jgi:hypothetical protein